MYFQRVKVGSGNFLTKAEGHEDGFHAALVEGYNFEKRYFICKNSWGNKTAEFRFNFVKKAAHWCKFIHVYFTMDSIRGKISKRFIPNMKKCIGKLNGETIDCAIMDKKTAFYISKYVCHRSRNLDYPMDFVGYHIGQWISINLDKYKRAFNQHKMMVRQPVYPIKTTINHHFKKRKTNEMERKIKNNENRKKIEHKIHYKNEITNNNIPHHKSRIHIDTDNTNIPQHKSRIYNDTETQYNTKFHDNTEIHYYKNEIHDNAEIPYYRNEIHFRGKTKIIHEGQEERVVIIFIIIIVIILECFK